MNTQILEYGSVRQSIRSLLWASTCLFAFLFHSLCAMHELNATQPLNASAQIENHAEIDSAKIFLRLDTVFLAHVEKLECGVLAYSQQIEYRSPKVPVQNTTVRMVLAHGSMLTTSDDVVSLVHNGLVVGVDHVSESILVRESTPEDQMAQDKSVLESMQSILFRSMRIVDCEDNGELSTVTLEPVRGGYGYGFIKRIQIQYSEKENELRHVEMIYSSGQLKKATIVYSLLRFGPEYCFDEEIREMYKKIVVASLNGNPFRGYEIVDVRKK